MDTIILILLIVVCIWALAPIISRWIQRKAAEMLIRRMTGGKRHRGSGSFGGFGMFDDFFGQTDQHRQGNSRQGSRENTRHRVHEYMRSVSETVSFEEISGGGKDASATSDQNRGRQSQSSEPRISDAEWEDL